MKRQSLFLLLAGMFAMSAAPADEAADREAVVGMVKGEVLADGARHPNDTMTVQGDELTLRENLDVPQIVLREKSLLRSQRGEHRHLKLFELRRVLRARGPEGLAA